MTEEMQALEKNQTWDIVSLPEGKKTHQMQMSFFSEAQAGLFNISAQSKASGMCLYANLWC